MTQIFLSYRRDDTGDMAGRLAAQLRRLPQKPSVFFDVDGIAYGQDFLDRIMGVVPRADVVLVLIGGAWRGARADGARILDDNDVVRAEVALALRTNRRIIPLLYNNTRMPVESELPADLGALPRINGIEIRRNYFDRDIEILFDAIWGANREKPGRSLMARIVGVVGRALAGSAIAGVIMIGGLVIYRASTGNSLESLLGWQAEPTIMAAIGFVLAGACAGIWWPRKQRTSR